MSADLHDIEASAPIAAEDAAPADSDIVLFMPDQRAAAAVLEATREHPEHAELLTAALSLAILEPTHDLMRWGHARLYELHLAELIGRTLAGGDLTMPTAAELLLACSEASLRAPLNRTGGELFELLMREVFGDHPVLATIPLSPPAPASCTIDDARRHLARALQRRLERSPVRGKNVIALLPGRGTNHKAVVAPSITGFDRQISLGPRRQLYLTKGVADGFLSGPEAGEEDSQEDQRQPGGSGELEGPDAGAHHPQSGPR